MFFLPLSWPDFNFEKTWDEKICDVDFVQNIRV